MDTCIIFTTRTKPHLKKIQTHIIVIINVPASSRTKNCAIVLLDNL
jgi:hypothetical protein